MKILQLIPREHLPPDDGGRISMWNVTKHLVRAGASVTVVALSDADDDSVVEFEGCGFRLVRFRHSTRNSPSAILRSVFGLTPLYLQKHFNAVVLEKVTQLCRTESFDVIHADHTAMAPLALALKQRCSVPVGLRLHNVEWMIWQRYADELHVLDPRRWYVSSQARKLRRAEASCIADAGVNWTMSDVDRKRALALAPHARIVTAPAGVNTDEWNPPTDAHRVPHQCVLAASWSWRHNVEGLRWFIENVFSRVRSVVPDATLLLPGKNLPDEFRQAEQKGIIAAGYVKSMQPSYHSSALFVCPLFVGSGVRIKIMEAMAAGLPVVATSVGAEGVEAGRDDGLIIADDPGRQADEIIRLMRDASQREQLSEAARQYVSRHHEWSQSIEIMARYYGELAMNVKR